MEAVGTHSSSSSMPLVSRLDHLDFLMKYLERKQSLAIWGSNGLAQGLERQCVPLDLAAKEAVFKGSLLDRVTSLEHRLFQLCLGMQSSSASSSSSRASTQTPGDCSFRTFNNIAIHGDKLMSHIAVDRLEIQEEKPHRHRVSKELKIASAPRQHLKKEEKTCKSRKKKEISPNWPRLKILGC